jgi:hypothetical protein
MNHACKDFFNRWQSRGAIQRRVEDVQMMAQLVQVVFAAIAEE